MPKRSASRSPTASPPLPTWLVAALMLLRELRRFRKRMQI